MFSGGGVSVQKFSLSHTYMWKSEDNSEVNFLLPPASSERERILDGNVPASERSSGLAPLSWEDPC